MVSASPTELAERLRPFEIALRRARQQEDAHNSDSLYFPSIYERELFVTTAEAIHVGLNRVKVCSADTFDASTFENTIWRSLAKSGIRIKVVYLVGHVGLVDTALVEELALAAQAGINVRVLPGHAVPEDIAELQVGDTLIVDESLVVYRNSPRTTSQANSGQWTITSSSAHISQFGKAFKELWEAGWDPNYLPDRLDLEEPLVQSAPIISDVAPVLCRGDHIDKHHCDWYHGTWQLLRLMNLVSTPSWHHEFYSKQLAQAVGEGARDFLITGTADYSVFAYVLAAVADIPSSTITVVDLCQTPLFACQWYAKRSNFGRFEVVTQDVFQFLTDQKNTFDVVVTDAFLTRFEGEAVERVLLGWSAILRPRGRVITTIRVHSETDRGQTTEEAIRDFRQRAQVRWRRWSSFVPMRDTEVADRAERYARKMVSTPIGARKAVSELLERYLSCKFAQIADVPGELYPTKYMRVVLARKEI